MASEKDVVTIQNFIGGSFEAADATMDSFDPSTGTINATLPDSGPQHVERAVKAAEQAFPGWAGLSTVDRGRHLLAVAALLEARQDEFAAAESRDQGKPVWLASSVDIPRAAHNLRHFAETVPHLMGTCKPQPGFLNYTSREPVGVAGLISPWNLPLYLLTFKVAPALMCGNTVVAKPSELTSVTAFMLCRLFQEAGVPPGVLNMVFGSGRGAGGALVAHPRVPLVSFTGSTLTGGLIAGVAAPLFKKVSLEMGGKNAAVVFADADLDAAVATLRRSCFLNSGQVCLCTSRVFVQRAVYEEVLQRLVAVARDITVGDPTDDKTFLGPLNSAGHLAKVQGCVQKALSGGASLQCGYPRDACLLPPHLQEGYYMRPTVLTDVADDQPAMTEEIFGPVVVVTPFDTEDEVVGRANAVPYGLCAAVFTSDLRRAHATAQALKVGTVWTNCWLVRDLDLPFGGTKDSGVGREGTHESWDFYTEQKTVCLKL